jgi:hypothetical protein
MGEWKHVLKKVNLLLLKILLVVEILKLYSWSEFESRLGQDFFLSTSSRPALRPKQSPIQWVMGAVSLAVKRPEREAEHSSPTIA